jgi:DNA-directed RNA polymerase subunit RPC12/RpoP
MDPAALNALAVGRNANGYRTVFYQRTSTSSTGTNGGRASIDGKRSNLPLSELTLYECPKCGETFEAFTFGKQFECPFCSELFEKIRKPDKNVVENKNVVERMIILRKIPKSSNC